jgi:hypothetical protein
MFALTFRREDGTEITGPVVERTDDDVRIAVTVDNNDHETIRWDEIVSISVERI